MKAVDIQWDVDFDEVYEVLDNMRAKKAAEELEIPYDRYANMTTEERHDYAYDVFRHSPGRLYEFLEIPDEVEIPEEIVKKFGDREDFDEIISDWLSDEYGYCHNGFRFDFEKNK